VRENLTSIIPIEEELGLLFSTADFDRNVHNQSVLPNRINVEDDDETKLPDPLDILRHRYSTFLFKKPEDPKDSRLFFGGKYTAYQTQSQSSKFPNIYKH